MTSRNKMRSSSALGKLETSDDQSILNAVAVFTEPVVPRAQSCPAGLKSQKAKTQRPAPPDWLLKEYLKGQRMRSHSVDMEDIAQGKTPPHHVDLTRSLRRGKIEHQVTLEDLKKLNIAFQEFQKRGQKFLDLDMFIRIMKKCVKSPNKDDFCTYLQLEYSEQADSLARQKEVYFVMPALSQGLSHSGPVLRIFSLPDDTLIMMGEDGVISFWSPQLTLKRRKLVFHKAVNRKSKWVTDFISMPQYNKLIIGTGDRAIQLYELSSLEPHCQIGGLDSIPPKLDYCYVDPDKCLILYGDDQGCVNILFLASVGELLRTWKKLPPVENMPTIRISSAVSSPNVKYVRWKVHEDWVTQLNYYDSIQVVISASIHEPTALVIGCTTGTTNAEQKMKEMKDVKKDGKVRKWHQSSLDLPQRRAEGDQTVFRVRKGVRAFSFCKRNNLLLTGGMDRIIRIWNPYVPGKPTGVLKSHRAPVFYLHIGAEEKRIFSMSTDNTVKIWDLENHNCLFSACPKTSGIQGELTACHYLSSIKALCVATNSVSLLHLKMRARPETHLVVSHKEPVVCCIYNKTFGHVVSCSEGSVIKVWDSETGMLLSEFIGAHGNAEITCLTFDSSGRRLVTGGRDGCLRIWNYNNGHCLKTLTQDEKHNEVCDCTYVEVYQNKYIIAVGWDRRINMYFDSPHDFHHFWKPQPHWPDDLIRGHKDDILCVVQCPPSLLATSSYDGEIIIWNMISGHVYCKLNTPVLTHHSEDLEDRSVSHLTFLKTRAAKFESKTASLISNGPQGSVIFWSLFSDAQLIASFIPSRGKSQISSIVVTTGDTCAYAADQLGYIYTYDIKDYALEGPEKEPPKNVKFWRAHVNAVTSLELIEKEKTLLSSSVDCTVRLWSMDGEYIGTFGQSELWDVFTSASWKHPMVPYEILMDPQSMPVHQVLAEDVSSLQINHMEEDKKIQEKSFAKVRSGAQHSLGHTSRTGLEQASGHGNMGSSCSSQISTTYNCQGQIQRSVRKLFHLGERGCDLAPVPVPGQQQSLVQQHSILEDSA
ncbi:cilia- and flagella-associated protein 337-like isoform X3 [Notamacropus eugenii]|uniref:cilia- and flagella-associated protein 337-like isoform X3 n=1 Tax=Notamacropus eugenii TaxID=9315 RepID=UPI003B66D17E